MSSLLEESVQLLRSMVKIPSESFEEENVSGLIRNALSGWGVDYRAVGNNIVALNRRYDPALPTLALDAHIDTVPPAQSYTRDPYDPGDDPDVIWGLGSNDDGGSVVSMIAAFRHFYDREMPVNLALLLSGEEERSGMNGAQLLYNGGMPEIAGGIRWVIIGEPTGMRVATSERGLLVLDCLAEGVSGHAARNEGVNALYIALEDISKLREYGKEKLNVTQISAGTAHNVIPDKCTFVVDIRPAGQHSNEEILADLQGMCRSRLTPRNMKNRASATYAGSPLKKTADMLGLETFSSPTTSNWMRTGRDAVKMGPGESSRSHHADEFIKVSEIGEAIEKYIEFIETFYGNSLE